MNEENISILKLFLAADIGTVRLFKLLEKFGKAENVFKAKRSDLINVAGIGEKTADAIIDIKDSGKAEKELTIAKNNNISLTMFTEENYPEPLKDYPDMPLILYVKGNITDKDYASLSIVGSRKATNYGKSVTDEFAGYFARKGITIVSGLARGIDTQSHIAAIQNKGRTIAVLGNGLMVNYPPENMILQAKIPENGAVISECPLTKQPDKSSFPRRNRIIAAFSRATLVVEASLQSGSLITARYCAEYGKDVFAVPGSIYSEFSAGSNMLIKEGASVVLNVKDMADQTPYFNILEEERSERQQEFSNLLNKSEQTVLDLISKNDEGLHADEIAQQLNIEISAIAAIILKLEINGLIKPMPGRLYVRAR
ncbi:MAG: DNA-processing protein DprA [Endomicrobium sp.]|jgi:DNA processing protein|nr:DNA-processing protein DprA [Endomicrobium sp.]